MQSKYSDSSISIVRFRNNLSHNLIGKSDKVMIKQDLRNGVNALNIACQECLKKSDFNAALEHFTEALGLMSAKSEFEIQADLLNNLEHVLVKLRKFEEVHGIFERAQTLYRREGEELTRLIEKNIEALQSGLKK